MDIIYYYCGNFASFFCIVPLMIGFYNWKFINLKSIPVFILLVIVLLVECINQYSSYRGYNTYPITRIYTLIEFMCLTVFYKRFFQTQINAYFFYLIMIGFAIIALIDAFLINSIYKSDTIAFAVEAITMLIFSVLSFYVIMKNMLYEKITDEPFFWINSAYLIYFSGTLFLFIFLNYILKNKPEYFIQLYFINSLLNLLSYSLISVGLWKTRKV